jgi:four helix bundle protein
MGHHESEQQLAWEQTRPEAITSDVLWKLDAYRVAMFLIHIARQDCRQGRTSRADSWLLSQLVRAAGSVSANLSEGYSRPTRADRLRFLGYALSSTRECIPWYESLRDAIPDDVIDERIRLLARLRSLLLGVIRSLREDGGGGPGRLEH